MKNNLIYYLSILMISLFYSCSKDSGEKNYLFISYDEIAGFTNNPTIIISPLSHSGTSCVRVNKEQVYGATYSRKLGEISKLKIKKINVKAWVRPEAANSGLKLVCSVDNDSSKTIYWNAFDSKSFNTPTGEWTLMQGTFDLSGKNNPGNKLNIYPMYDTGGNLLFDDLEINIE